MEDQMTTPTSYLRDPVRSRSISLGLRIAVLTLDFTIIITLAVSIGLYHKWIPDTSYPTTALNPDTHTDWTDPVVLAAILISFSWTLFITIHPAWTSKALHLGYHVAFEFVCLVWLLACTIPALILRESDFKNLVAISNTCDMDALTLMNGEKLPWVCMPHLNTLKKLQTATYSVACAVAVLHLILFSLACRSTLSPPQHHTQTAAPPPPPHTGNISLPKPAYQQPTTTTNRLSESDSSLQPQPQPRIQIESAEF